MTICILAVGKLRESYYKAGVEDYIERIKRWLPVEHIEVATGTGEESNGKGTAALVREAENLNKYLKRPGVTVILDPHGAAMSTEEFSGWLQTNMNRSAERITFVIGGAWGLESQLKDSASLLLKLSDFTFPHELARLVIAEQVYRALSLWKGMPYHK